MKPLAPPDSLHLQAAQGWCELHALAEAEGELENMPLPSALIRRCWGSAVRFTRIVRSGPAFWTSSAPS